VNATANNLAVGAYGPTTITFAGQGTQTRTATLTVNPLLGVAVTVCKLPAANVPPPLTVPSAATKSARTVTFTINSSAHGLQPNTYVSTISFTNTTNNQGNTTRVASLVVNPKEYKVTVRASPSVPDFGKAVSQLGVVIEYFTLPYVALSM
jgi:hypothetical protein